jgi:hypothetical protein
MLLIELHLLCIAIRYLSPNITNAIAPFDRLFRELILEVFSFLSPRDGRSFSLCSKSCRMFLVPKLQFNLNTTYSMWYFQIAMGRGMNVREYICASAVFSLLLSRGSVLSALTFRDFAEPVVDDVTMLGGFESLSFQYCHRLVDVTPIATVKSLTFNSCNGLVDVSSLAGSKVQVLKLLYCKNVIRGIELLGGLQELSLCGSTQITDSYLVHLSSVKKLCLRDCKLLTDVSALGSVRNLDLSMCTGIRRGLRCLGKVHTLNLAWCTQVTDADIAHLGSVSDLNLFNCRNITDVTPLGGVKVLNLSFCIGIRRGWNCLTRVERLCAEACTQVMDMDIVTFGSMSHLHLGDCYLISNVSHLGKVKVLSLEGCTGIKRGWEHLGGVRYLRLDRCTQVANKDVVHLASIPYLSVARCNGITDFSPLFKVRVLHLGGCCVSNDESSPHMISPFDRRENLVYLDL